MSCSSIGRGVRILTGLKVSFFTESEPAGQTLPDDELHQTKLEGSDPNDDLTSQEVDVDAKKDGMKNYFACLYTLKY